MQNTVVREKNVSPLNLRPQSGTDADHVRFAVKVE